MKKAIVLLSGGLDSSTCLAIAKNEGYACYALSFSYGQRQSVELQAAVQVAKTLGVVEHRIFDLNIGQFGGSALTDENIDIPAFKGDGKIPVTYVPARNTIFLSIALGWAEIVNASAIYIGASFVDYSGYPDCRPEFFDAFQTLSTLATKTGVEGHPIILKTPLLYLTKAETIQKGVALSVPYALTITCYQADKLGQACGVCDSCHLRKKGFEEAQVKDPTRYVI